MRRVIARPLAVAGLVHGCLALAGWLLLRRIAVLSPEPVEANAVHSVSLLEAPAATVDLPPISPVPSATQSGGGAGGSTPTGVAPVAVAAAPAALAPPPRAARPAVAPVARAAPRRRAPASKGRIEYVDLAADTPVVTHDGRFTYVDLTAEPGPRAHSSRSVPQARSPIPDAPPVAVPTEGGASGSPGLPPGEGPGGADGDRFRPVPAGAWVQMARALDVVPVRPRIPARGAVMLRLGVGRDGVVRSVRTVKSSGNPVMDEAAEASMWATRFSPCLTVAGTPVDCEISYGVELRR